MKTLKKKVLWFTVIGFVGLVLLISTILKGNNDSFITAFASGLIILSFPKIIQFMKISQNSTLLKKFETLQKEERFIMIAEKSGRYTLLLTVILELISGIIFMFIGRNDLATIICLVAGIQTFAYTVIFYRLSKKY